MPHSPQKARTNIPVRNVDAFYGAFGIKSGEAMYIAPGDRVGIC
jgi:predicted metalloendopeptidase